MPELDYFKYSVPKIDLNPEFLDSSTYYTPLSRKDVRDDLSKSDSAIDTDIDSNSVILLKYKTAIEWAEGVARKALFSGYRGHGSEPFSRQ